MSENNILVIFGSTGDLTFTKLLPAIAELNHHHPERIQSILLIGRQVTSLDAYLELGREKGLPLDRIENLLPKLRFHAMQTSEHADYRELAHLLMAFSHRYVYCATPPSLFWTIVDALHHHHIIEKGNPNHRVAFEKPFGEDETAANVLNELLSQHLDETQMYRVDHYLAKPMIDQVLNLRHELALLDPLFRAPTLKKVVVKAYETLGIMTRGKFYEATGAINDMIQSHLLFTLARACAPLTYPLSEMKMGTFLKECLPQPDNMAIGQYVGYRDEMSVSPESVVETFAALPFKHALPRYHDVMFWIVTGKRCSEKVTSITYTFVNQSTVTFRIAPLTGIVYDDTFLELCSEEQKTTLIRVAKQKIMQQEAYETIFDDFVLGKQRLFPSTDDILTSWTRVAPFHQAARFPILYTHEDQVWKEQER